MKKLILSLTAVFILSANVFAGEPKEVKKPAIESQGAVLMDFETGRVLWEKDCHKPLAMASTTKIMTAVTAIELGSLDSAVMVTKRAAGAPPVKMGLSAGEEISLQSLLYALMLQSSNDAAVAIAEHIGGTVENFCTMMTEKARELGAKDTVFETPNGLDSEHHVSTAYDMALITRYAMKNDTFVKLINTPSANVKSSKRSYEIANKNRLLNEYGGANGVKTGYTGKAGHCFVGAAKRDGMQLISVVLASGWGEKGKQQKWKDTKSILNYGFGNYKYYSLVSADEEAAGLTVARTKTPDVKLIFGQSLKLPLSADEKQSVTVRLEFDDNIKAPVAIGDKLGCARIMLGESELAQIDLCAANEAERHDMKTSIEKALNIFLGLTTNAKPDINIPEWYYSE